MDLSEKTVLPGWSTIRPNVLWQAHPTPTDYDEHGFQESISYRPIRATVWASIALRNRVTTIRDLETEGAIYTDVTLPTSTPTQCSRDGLPVSPVAKPTDRIY